MSEAFTRDITEYVPGAEEALSLGGEFEYKPDTAEVGTWHVAYDSDEDKYYEETIVSGFRIRDNKVFHTFWCVDSDGNWDDDGEECDIDSPDYPAWLRTYLDPEEIEEDNKKYYQYVAKTGDDPLGAFWVQPRAPHTFKVFLHGSILGVMFMKAVRYSGNGTVLRPGDPNFPRELWDYFLLTDRGKVGVGPYYIDDPEIKTVNDVRKLAGDTIKWTSTTKLTWIRSNGLITLDVPRLPSIVKRELKALAKKALVTSPDVELAKMKNATL